MNLFRIRLVVMTAAFAAAPAMAAQAGENGGLPLRKGGQWELKTVMDEGGGPRGEHALQICIDDAMEKSTAEASRREHEASCASYQLKSEGEKTVVESDCTFEMQAIQSRTEMSGDFKTAFTVKIESTTVRSGGGQSVPVKRTITQTGRYVGTACQAGLAPGEAMASDGTKMNVQ